MHPKIIRQIIGSDAVNHFCSVYELHASDLKQQKLHDGAANLLYRVSGENPGYLRISYRKDRDLAMIETELDFLSFLAERGFKCPRPIRSQEAKLCETWQMGDHLLTAALFTELNGKHLYEMQFRLPAGVTVQQFWQQCGKTLGVLHALSHAYLKQTQAIRFTWLDRHEQSLPLIFADRPEYRVLLKNTLDQIRSLPRSFVNHGLCHNDFNVCNFLIDYDSREFELKLLDFDDSGFNYYMYDLACLWEMCTGWAINLVERAKWQDYMHRCFSTILEEYHKHYEPDFNAVELLPLFLKAVHIENILEPLREFHYAEKSLILDKEVCYHIHCLQHNVEYLGLFEDFFVHRRPFRLP